MNKESIIKFLKEHVGIFLINVIIFIVLFLLIPLMINHVNSIICRTLFVLTIIVVTDLFYLFNKMKYEHILYSLLILFIFNLIFLDYCTIRDLYGITSHGSLDKSPAILDALLVDMVIVFIEYVTLFITRFIKKIINKNKKVNNKKEEKIEEKVEEKKVEEKKVEVKKKTTTKKPATSKTTTTKKKTTTKKTTK